MKKILIIFILVVAGGAAWYFASPLFLNTEVNEAFPAFDSMPTPEELAAMSPEELAAVEDKVLQMGAQQPDTVITEPMPGMAEMMTEEVKDAEEQNQSSSPLVVAEGNFMDADSFHRGSGHAGVYRLPDGASILRFEDFSVTNGPDLRVLLSASVNPTSSAELGEYIELGKLKGNKGDQNYEIPADADIEKFKSVVIYCKPFHVVFATAVFD